MERVQSATTSMHMNTLAHKHLLSPLLLFLPLLLCGGSQILIKKKMRKRFHFSQIGPHSSKGKEGDQMRDGGVKGGRQREKDTQEDNSPHTKKRRQEGDV